MQRKRIYARGFVRGKYQSARSARKRVETRGISVSPPRLNVHRHVFYLAAVLLLLPLLIQER